MTGLTGSTGWRRRNHRQDADATSEDGGRWARGRVWLPGNGERRTCLGEGRPLWQSRWAGRGDFESGSKLPHSKGAKTVRKSWQFAGAGKLARCRNNGPSGRGLVSEDEGFDVPLEDGVSPEVADQGGRDDVDAEGDFGVPFAPADDDGEDVAEQADDRGEKEGEEGEFPAEEGADDGEEFDVAQSEGFLSNVEKGLAGGDSLSVGDGDGGDGAVAVGGDCDGIFVKFDKGYGHARLDLIWFGSR